MGLENFTSQQAKARAAAADYTLRCVAEVYETGTDKVVLHKPLQPELQDDGTYTIELQLPEGSYDLRLWSDYARTDAPLADAFYHTESLKAVNIFTEPYTGDTEDKGLHCPCYESFNVLTNSGTGTSTIINYRACYNFSAGEMMRSDYLFCTEETQTLSIEYSGRPTQKVLTNVPVNPNKHIILKGDYASIGLTNANFSVTLDEDWGTGSGTTDF